MKFFCDRCKTRYSIGDDRVRGKILKIRCKNCANVITVREGMADPDGADAAPRARPTTGAAALVGASAPSSAGALGAAFASQLAKPPPALEEEWYVSIDGVQSGPFSLGEAQRWVQGKPFDADLHCWSEGFDDWLPVDKVSHFRGLRKRPVAKTNPPPIPRREDEPKPLFAATMASLEKGAAAPERALPPIASAQTLKGPGAPAAAKANGIGIAAPVTTGRGTAPAPALPKVAPRGPAQAAAALAAAFQQEDASDSMTAVDAPMFDEEAATSAEPVAAKRTTGERAPLKPEPAPGPARGAPERAPADRATPDRSGPDRFDTQPSEPPADGEAGTTDDEDNLEIGEVSRVVKLTDLAVMNRKPKSAASGTQPVQRPAVTGSVPRIAMSGNVPKVLSPSELGMNVDPALAQLATAPGQPAPDESVLAQSFAQRHRRGMLLLVTASALVLLGVVAVVVVVASGGEEDLPVGLGGTTRRIDTSRPEDIVRRQLPPPPNTGSGSAAVAQQRPRWRPANPGTNVVTPPPEEEPGKGGLKASEVEEMAAKNGEGTKRCYMRAQRGSLGFEIADLKKIAVTLTVAKDGTVTDVQLSAHSGDSFGQCLVSRIKAWKFRESSGGTFRISLAFSNT